MAILKSEVRNKFSAIPNSIIRAKDVSDGDYRLMIYLYSLPNGWKVNQSYLANELKCNLRNINAKIKRLKDLGYLEIVRDTKSKETDFIYVLKEKDTSVNDTSVNDTSVDNALVNDALVNDVYINNNIINTNKINNDINKKEIYKESQKSSSYKLYGEYKRIKLKDEEYEKLCKDYGKEKVDNQIKQLDEYVESNNNKNKYSNFNLVLRKSFRENWFKQSQNNGEREWIT